MPKRALIFINGDLPNLDATRGIIRPDDFIIAADGGTRHALALGLLPSVVIGDLDSLDPVNRRVLEENRVKIIEYPQDKDETDIELALAYAIEAGYKKICLVAALGGRLDHTLGNLSLLSDVSLSGLDVRIDDGVEEVFFTRHQAKILGRIGDIVSLIPWGNPVIGIHTEGLRWQLSDETLYPHKTRGISNEMIAEAAEIQIESALLLVIHTRQEGASHQINGRCL
ncbi:MAG: thiamine diphosphokinase [Anaerolineae bacterium]|jgi:thiamine pyrophosphokinase|nr:thiamine diphosphokinase [Anaerolineae bacterium]MBT7189063.1 thiamine diphosphokinase [Anaerolineae bacterium]MBT7990336.1 thiamine diphosphokinase [Anaerolineae bacterium]